MPKGMAAREAVLDGWEVYLYAFVCVERARRNIYAHKHLPHAQSSLHAQARLLMHSIIETQNACAKRRMKISAMQSSGQSSFGVPIECVWTVLVLFDIPFALLRWPAQPFLVALSGAH